MGKIWRNIVNEQTVYQTPGESHTSREGATEYCIANYRAYDQDEQCNPRIGWATYMVDLDEKIAFHRMKSG